jgi:hypothetical protein
MPKDGSFSNRKESQKERLRFLPAPMVGLGRSVSRVEMNAKYSALDTALPKQTLPYALFTAKGPEKSLDKADTVIHGAPQFCSHLSGKRSSLANARSATP